MLLFNKLFEYLYVGVFVVSSDLLSLCEFFDEIGVGVMFLVEDVDVLVVVVCVVLVEYECYVVVVSDL